MEQFQDLFINCSQEDAELLIKIVREKVQGHSNWEIDENQMEYSKSIDYGEGLGFLCINYIIDSKKPTVTFLHSPAGRLYIPNIVPNKGKLSYSEYNKVFRSFVEEILNPIINTHKNSYKMKLTEPVVNVKTVLSENLAKLLTNFSDIANKGTTHWADQARWRKFVIAAYKSKDRPSGTVLNRLLEEELGWPPERASDLVVQYEFALELLKDYDNQ